MERPGSGEQPGLRARDARSIDEVLEEHGELRDAAARIAHVEDAATLGERLDGLLSLLETHFAREEGPRGALAWIEARSPDQAALFRTDHGEILAAVRDLVRRVRELDEPGRGPLEAELDALLKRVALHDAQEAEVLTGGDPRRASARLRDDRPAPAPGPAIRLPAANRPSALEVNLKRTAVEVEIPADQQVLLEITASAAGVQRNTRVLLHEVNHPYVGWSETLDDLHRRAMGDLSRYLAHERASEAIEVFARLYQRAATEAGSNEVRETAVRDELTYLEKVVTQAAARLPDLLPAVGRALAGMDGLLSYAPQLAIIASPRLRRLCESLHAEAPGHAVTEVALRLFGACLRQVYAHWLERDDPVAWWRDGAAAGPGAEVPEAVAAISHAQLTSHGRTLDRGDEIPLEERAAALLGLPDGAALERAYLAAASCVEVPGREEWRNRLERIRWLIRLLSEEALAPVHEQALSEITHSVATVLRGAEREQLAHFVKETFESLRACRISTSPSALNLISKIGLELLATRDPEWAQLLCDEILACEFPTPEFSGFTDEWQVRVNPAHLRAIRTWLSLIEANPQATRPLLAGLVVHLRIGGIFIADTDLFQKDVSKLLNSDIGPVYHQLKRLLKIFPVYFSDIGAEGELREVSSRIDELGGRRDLLCHFLRKQCHVECNPRLVGFVDAVAHFWATGERDPLRPYLPPSLYEHLDIGSDDHRGLHAVFSALVGSGGVSELFEQDLTRAERRIGQVAGVSEIDREKAILLLQLRRLIAAKYELAHEDLLERLASFQRIDKDQVETLRDALTRRRHETAVEILLSMLECLRDTVVVGERTEGVEDIYRKRHIAVGIPSIYGRYREEKFEAMGLSFRIESMATALFGRMIASHNLEYITKSTLRDVAVWLRLLLRALRVDGCSGRGLATGTAMLDQALEAEGISVDQYINIFQFISRTVEQLIRIRFLDVYEGIGQRLVRQMLEGGAIQAEPGEAPRQTALKVSEAFLRDLISESFGLQQLDNLIGKVLRTLTSGREKLDGPTLNLLMSYDPQRFCSPIDGRESSFDGALSLGNKGYMIKRLAVEGLPVPPGFILTTEVFRCRPAILASDELRAEVVEELRRQVARLEALTGNRFGDASRPLLLSVRSGAAISMPGVLDTFLNVGISEKVAEGFAERCGSAWAAWDAYRRFLQFWGMGHGMERDLFDVLMRDAKHDFSVAKKSLLSAEHMREVSLRYRDLVRDHGVALTDDPFAQLHTCIDLVLSSWHSPKARAYRRAARVAEEWGTAVIAQNMVYGNLSERSGTGVVLTCDPRRTSGDVRLYGDFIVKSQGDDVVSGLVDTIPISEEQRLEGRGRHSLERDFPAIYAALERHGRLLVHDLGMFHQELEFTFEGDDPADLYILQTRDTVLSPVSTVPTFEPGEALERAKVGAGIGAGGGALSGRVAHTAEDIASLRQKYPADPILLLRPDTVPDDIPLILEADGMVTAVGGATSHAALVAQRLGRTCVVGCRQLQVFEQECRSELGGRRIATGDFLSINGIDGSVYLGKHPSTRVQTQTLV